MKHNKFYLLITLLSLALSPLSVAVGQQVATEKTVTDTTGAKFGGNIIQPETVQLGFGITRPLDMLTAAVSQISGRKLQKSMVINPANALNGLVLGLIVLSNGGQPPTSPTLFIRGKSTLTDNSPLVLVDGFQWPISSLTIDEIQNVTVLKDAAALVKYGQRGANGVILVTTKRGEKHVLHVTASYQQAFTSPTSLPNMLGASKYARAMNEALINDGLSPRYGPADIKAFEERKYPKLYPNVNWFKQGLRDYGTRSKFNSTFSGGGDRIRYYTSMNMVYDIGLFGPASGDGAHSTQIKYNRFNFRTNLDVNVTKSLLFKLNVSGNLFKSNQPNGGSYKIVNQLYKIPSAAFPVKNANGSFGGSLIYENNPIADLSSTGYNQPNGRDFSLTGKLLLDLGSLLKGLSAKAMVSNRSYSTFNNGHIQQYAYMSVIPVRNQVGNLVGTNKIKLGQNTPLSYYKGLLQQRNSSDYVAQINYNTTINNNNSIYATVLYHQSSRSYKGQNNTFHRQNIYANIFYNLDSKYFFNVAVSYSGNNLLPPGKKFNIFPAISAGWLISKEGFLENASFLDQLKLRASWGVVGSDRLPATDIYRQRYLFAAGYRFGKTNSQKGGFKLARLPTKDFTVELAHMYNFGFNARFFNSLWMKADIFYTHRTDILVNSSGVISDVIGFEQPLRTDGIVNNKGIEASLKWQNNIGNVAYFIGGKFSFTQNEIINKDEESRRYPYLRRTGQPVGQTFGLQAIGFFKNKQDIANSPKQQFGPVKPGDIKYKDQNDDKVINQYDVVPLGYARGYPEIYYGISFGISYKGFKVSALLQGTGHYTAYLNTPSVFWPLRDNTTISTYYYNHRWTPNTAGSATLPRLSTGMNNNNFRPNSVWMVNRSSLKLKNVKISYSLPVSVTHTLNLNKILLFVTGTNLFSIDNIPVMNTEFWTGYPILRTYSAGLKIEF